MFFLKKRTNVDKAKSVLFNTIVGARKVVKTAVVVTKGAYQETKATTKAAWNHKI